MFICASAIDDFLSICFGVNNWFLFLDLIYISCISDRSDGGSTYNSQLDYPGSICS